MQGTYNVEQLNDLKKDIEERQDEILKEIAHALGTGNNDMYNHLKQLQLQCAAELRLIKHIESGMKDEFLIC